MIDIEDLVGDEEESSEEGPSSESEVASAHGFDMSIPPPRWVSDPGEAREWVQYFLATHKQTGGLGLDSETTGLNRTRDYVLIWSISDGVHRLCLPRELISVFKEPILENPEVCFDGTNINFDAHMFANSGAEIWRAGEWRCTMTQSWLNNENNRGRHGLKECVRQFFGRDAPSFEKTFGKIPPKRRDREGNVIVTKTVGDLIREALADPIKFISATDYASLDAYNSTMLRRHLDTVLDQTVLWTDMNGQKYTLKNYFYSIETAFTKVLWKMERRGITVDLGYLREQQAPMEEALDEIEKAFARENGGLINLNSTSDIREFFITKLGLVSHKKTSGGTTGIKKDSTDASVLEAWADDGNVWARTLMKHRGIKKIHGTYVLGLQHHTDERTCRVHTTMKQTGTVTGRISSTDPNLMNIPRAAEDVWKIREAFVPGEGKILIVADYAQLEMRLMAHFSRDPKMIDAILRDIDLHCLTVSEMYGIPYEEVISAVKAEKKIKKGERKEPLTAREQELILKRQHCKATGFGIIYGIGGKRLAANLSEGAERPLTEDEGFDLIEKWFRVFPTVRDFIEETKRQLMHFGYVQTLMGRYRRLGDVRLMSKKDKALSERQAVNSIIQGSAADIAKRAMVIAEHDPELIELRAEMLLQIHDELIFEGPNSTQTLKPTMSRVKNIMENPFSQPLLVPLPAEVGSGFSWATAK